MQNGTISYLEGLQEKHPDIELFLMTDSDGALAYYENDKRIFANGREYDVIASSGTVLEDGFVVMNNIPATNEGSHILENNFKKRQNSVDHMPGFQAFRFLKPIKGHTYVAFTQWRSVDDFENWKDSDAFKQAHQDQSIKKPAYFIDRPFTTTYTMYQEDEEEE